MLQEAGAPVSPQRASLQEQSPPTPTPPADAADAADVEAPRLREPRTRVDDVTDHLNDADDRIQQLSDLAAIEPAVPKAVQAGEQLVQSGLSVVGLAPPPTRRRGARPSDELRVLMATIVLSLLCVVLASVVVAALAAAGVAAVDDPLSVCLTAW